jgi:hypothetical protein
MAESNPTTIVSECFFPNPRHSEPLPSNEIFDARFSPSVLFDDTDLDPLRGPLGFENLVEEVRRSQAN